jgi:lysyl endopeptidase
MIRIYVSAMLTVISSCVAAQIVAVPPSSNPDQATPKAAAAMLLPSDTPARQIALGPLTPTEDAQTKAAAARRTEKPGVPLQIGIARSVGADDSVIRLADLPWRPVQGSGSAARIELTSTGASALRLGIVLRNAPSGLTLRFAGAGAPLNVFGPFAAHDFPTAFPYWSPVVDGERAIVELELPPGVSPGDAVLELPTISHLTASAAQLKAAPDPFKAIGSSGSCEVDVACTADPPAALLSAASSVVRLALTYRGSTFLCTGTLLNDSVASHSPYIFTANHCLDNPDAPANVLAASTQSAEAANSVNSYWFFQASTCRSRTTPNYTLLAGGAKLMARSFDYDWALLRLNDQAPPGAAFSAWRAEPLVPGTPADTFHHPRGDLTKVSVGAATGYHTYLDGSSFAQMQWTQGATEPGSSGAGLFVVSPDGSAYELRGGLYGGSSSCSTPGGTDDFSRLDLAAPLLAQYLTPNSGTASGAVPVVEFYDALLDDYFVTANAAEINDLDTGVHPGWIRTGYRFLAYANANSAPAGASPVCRFYVQPAFGDSHFYSADPQECAATQAKFPTQWVFESPTVFYILLPDKTSGACPSNSHAVYRFLNNANGLHHRYTAEVDLRDVIIEIGTWTQEGYGFPPAQVVMCSPNS